MEGPRRLGVKGPRRLGVRELKDHILKLFPKDIFLLIDSFNGPDSLKEKHHYFYILLGVSKDYSKALECEGCEGNLDNITRILDNCDSHKKTQWHFPIKIKRSFIAETKQFLPKLVKNNHFHVIKYLLDEELLDKSQINICVLESIKQHSLSIFKYLVPKYIKIRELYGDPIEDALMFINEEVIDYLFSIDHTYVLNHELIRENLSSVIRKQFIVKKMMEGYIGIL